MERKVYSSWAFKGDELKKRDINSSIYKKLKNKAKRFYGDEQPTQKELKNLMCYKSLSIGYGNQPYKIISNPHKLSDDEMALICDRGNLCFGYRGSYPRIIIHTD